MGSKRRISGAVVAAALAVTVAACGGDNKSDSGSTKKSPAASSGTAGRTTALTAIKPYIGKPGAFPVTEPLSKSVKGKKIAFMDCGTPVCALFWQLIQPAGKTMGVKITRYKAGQSAASVDSAFGSAIANKPDAVVVTAIDIALWRNSLKKLQAAKVPVATTGVTGVASDVKAPQAAENASGLEGKLLADYTATKTPADAKLALYDVPELPFTALVDKGFTTELAKVCPKCSVRTVHIPVTTIGNRAPQSVVSDLQAHPDTKGAIFAIDEAATGLPAALKTAGIKVTTIGNSPGPTNLQYLKEGQEDAALGVDLPVLIWTTLDVAARGITGDGLKGDEAKGISPVQFLRKQDIVFDPAMGWTGYPDFGKRFAKLWNPGA